MSLVNKVLRDLDARHIGAGERAALPVAVTPLAVHEEQRTRPAAVAAALAAILALAAVVGWQYLPAPAPAAPAAVAAAIPAPAAPRPIAASPPAQEGTPPAASPAAQPIATAATPPTAIATPPTNPDSSNAPSALRLSAELSAPAPRAPNPGAKAPRTTVTEKAAPSEKLRAAGGAPVPPQRVAEVAATKPAPPANEARVEKQERQPTAAQRAESEYRRGTAALRQGNPELALEAYRSALEQQAEHAAARQALAALLIDARRYDEAEDVLRKGSELAAVRLPSVLALARLKVERNQGSAALDLLQKHAVAGEASAEFQGFTGALLNRAGRAGEAAERYRLATRLAPADGRWWAGLGISLDAAGKSSEAREAYQRARQSSDLPMDLAQHVDQRLR